MRGRQGSGGFKVRTDLALESREAAQRGRRPDDGVAVREWREPGGCAMTEVRVKSERGARIMGKPVGTYLTMDLGRERGGDEGELLRAAEQLGQQIAGLAARVLGREESGFDGVHVLAVGLGNLYVTPDSLGPKVLGSLRISRNVADGEGGPIVSGIVPGVMAQTGMETAEILRGIIRETKPDLVVAVDALAARSVRRLGTTTQLTDTGIHPGSGVGNHRHGLTKKSRGILVPGLAVPGGGGPAATAQVRGGGAAPALERGRKTRGVGAWLEQMGEEEQYQLIREVLEPELGQLYVTPPDIDETVKRLSFIISEGIHRAFYGIG